MALTNEANPMLAKAWINWVQSGTQTINDSFNVTSITDNGTGRTLITFTNAFATANYVGAGAVKYSSNSVMFSMEAGSTKAAGYFEQHTQLSNNTVVDADDANAAFFGEPA